MGMNLAAQAEKIATTTVKWDGETVEVQFRPALLTPALLQSVTDAAEDEKRAAGAIGALLEPLLVQWDIYADDAAEAAGNRLGTDAKSIALLPIPFTRAVVEAMVEGQDPPKPRR